MIHEAKKDDLPPRSRMRLGPTLLAWAFLAALVARLLVSPNSAGFQELVVPMGVAIAFVFALWIIAYVGNIAAKVRLLRALVNETDAGAHLIVIRKSRELANGLVAIDELAGSQIKQRLCNFAALSIEDDGVSLWDCQGGALLVQFWAWPELKDASSSVSLSLFDSTRSICLAFASGHVLTLIPLGKGFLHVNKPLHDVDYRRTLSELRTRIH